LPFCQLRISAQIPPGRGYPLTLQTLGDHLKKRRLDLRLRQMDVAEQIGVHQGTYEKWEQGTTHEPEVRFFPAIVRFLGYDPSPAVSSEDLGLRLKAARRARGLSQESLARLLGVDESTVQEWEAGKRRRRARRVVRVVEEFLRGQGPGGDSDA
jgi:transcriptional regulator with XRE-family HTH domain